MFRLILLIPSPDGAWSVEPEGRFSDRSPGKALTQVSAERLMRAALSPGRSSSRANRSASERSPLA
jgi:hypothetical protein